MVNLFEDIPFFSCFNPEEIKILLKAGEEKKYDSYANIVIEGELSWGLYVLFEGEVTVLKSNPSSKNTYEIGRLAKGGFFGEMSLIDELPRSATVQTLRPSTCFFLGKDSFQKFLAQDKDRKLKFFQHSCRGLVTRLRELNDSFVISQYQLWKTVYAKNREAA